MSARDVARRTLYEPLFADGNVVLFEDDRTVVELFPLAVMRPSWEIRCGAGSLRCWLSSLQLSGMTLHLRPRSEMRRMADFLAGNLESEFDPESETVFLNGRVIGLWKSDEDVPDLPAAIHDGEGRLLMARLDGRRAERLMHLRGTELASRLVSEIEASDLPKGWVVPYARYAWDYMLNNARLLQRQLVRVGLDSRELLGARVLRDMPPGVNLTDPLGGHPVYVGSGTRLMPGAVLGNHAGPVWIGGSADVEPHTYLEGPLLIGPHARIKCGTRLYNGCSLGPHCRVAGELSAVVMEGFDNKQHEGFLGHSHLGRWVNLGADTRNSNLRNDYKTLRINVGGEVIDTGERYIGLMAGDHVKTGINTMFNTASRVGVGANLYGADYPPVFVPSFMKGGAQGLKVWSIERVVESARVATSRRGETLTEVEEELLRWHYAETVNKESSL